MGKNGAAESTVEPQGDIEGSGFSGEAGIAASVGVGVNALEGKDLGEDRKKVSMTWRVAA